MQGNFDEFDQDAFQANMEAEMGVPITVIESYEGSIIVAFDMLSDDTTSKEQLIEL